MSSVISDDLIPRIAIVATGDAIKAWTLPFVENSAAVLAICFSVFIML